MCLAFISPTVWAQDSGEFSVQTDNNRCVALRQGQICYKEINLRWQASKPGDYCLIDLDKNQSLNCWSQESQGAMVVEFASDHDLR